jgi:hypothetical protein
MVCNVNSTFSASRSPTESIASLGKPLSHALGQARVGLALTKLFNSLTNRFPIFGRPFMRCDDKIKVVDICYNGHRSVSLKY